MHIENFDEIIQLKYNDVLLIHTNMNKWISGMGNPLQLYIDYIVDHKQIC